MLAAPVRGGSLGNEGVAYQSFYRSTPPKFAQGALSVPGARYAKLGFAAVMLYSVELQAGTQDETTGIPFGSATLMPALRTELHYDDNIFESANDERDSIIAVLIPSLGAQLELGNSLYELGYSAESASYFDSEDDDYVDHKVQAHANMQFSLRNNVTARASFAAEHEDRGTGLTEGFDPTLAPNFNEPDEYEQTEASVRYTYGARGASGRLSFEAGYRDLQYQNHRPRTKFRDREDTSATATFYYRLRPKTLLVVQARATAIDYAINQPQQSTLDSDHYRYLIGVEWERSKQLSGAIKAGYQQKRFTSASRDDFSAPSWEADLTWSPRSYMHFNFKTDRSTEETNGGGDFIDVQRISTEWTHEWSERVQSVLGVAYVDEEYENFDRDEQVTEFAGNLAYQLKRWIALEIGTRYRDRSSNIDLLNFNRSVISVGIDIAI
ncbi:MAG: outer membrane beta-barrel protein [Pseudomonadales bacterium]